MTSHASQHGEDAHRRAPVAWQLPLPLQTPQDMPPASVSRCASEPVLARAVQRHRRARRGRRRFRLRWVILPLSLLLLLACLPTIVFQTGLRNWAVNQFLPADHWHAELGTVQGGWLTPLTLQQVQLEDQSVTPPAPLLTVEKIQLSQNLWSLVSNAISGPAHLGVLEVDAAEVWLERTDKGVNWQPVIDLCQQPADPQAQPTSYERILLRNAKLHIVDRVSQQEVTMDQVNAEIAPSSSPDFPQAKIDGTFITRGQQGTLRADLQANSAGRPVLASELNGFPLQILPVLLSIPSDQIAALSGELDLHIQAELGTNLTAPWSADIRAEGRQIQVSAPAWLGPDQPTWDTAWVAVRARGDQRQIEFEKCELKSPWIVAQGHGTLPLTSDLSAVSGEIQGQAQLAVMATDLPATLQMRPGLEWQSGEFEFRGGVARAEQGWQLELNGQATELAARDGQQMIRWEFPIQLTARGQARDAQHWQLDQLRLDTEFAQLDGQGSQDSGQIVGQADLGRLQTQLARFVALPWQELTGQGDGGLRWQRADKGLSWETEGELRQLRVAFADGSALEEPQSTWKAAGQLELPNVAQWRLLPATATLTFGAEQLQVRTLEPITSRWSQQTLPLEIELKGELSRWRQRCGSFLPPGLPATQGQIVANGKFVLGPTELVAQDWVVQLQPARIALAGVEINEPKTVLKSSFRYDLQQGQWSSAETSLQTTSFSMVGRDLAFVPGNLQVPPRGTLVWHGQLDRINRSLGNQLAQWGVPTVGKLNGSIKSLPGPQGMELQGAATLTDLQLPGQATSPLLQAAVGSANNSSSPWNLSFQGQWPAASPLPVLESWTLRSPLADVTAQSHLVATSPHATLETTGQAQFQWSTLMPLLPSSVQQMIQLEGSPTSPFRVRVALGPTTATSTTTAQAPSAAARAAAGRLVTASTAAVNSSASTTAKSVPASQLDIEAEVSTAWTAGRLLNLPLGPATVKARWQQDALELEPLEVALGPGTARLAGRVGTVTPYWLEVPPGPVLENLELAPELCRQWLKYVAPLAGNVADAEGSFSVQLNQLQLPLARPEAGNMNGTVHIQRGRLGPSPMSQQLLQIAQQIKSLARGGTPAGQIMAADADWILIPEQDIEFTLENGLVTHRAARFVVAQDLEIITSGSVGLDDSLRLVAEIPVNRSWLRDERVLALLEGQRLTIPIGGTVSRPQLDARALQQLFGRSVQRAAQSYLERELQGQFQKLLPGGAAPGGTAPGGAAPGGAAAPHTQPPAPGAGAPQQPAGPATNPLFPGLEQIPGLDQLPAIPQLPW